MDALTYNRNRKYSADIIKQIQRVLGVASTGTWNAETVAGVIEFQTDHQLTTDGKVGPTTLAMLQSEDASGDDHDDHDSEIESDPISVDSQMTTTGGAGAEPLARLREWCTDKHFELVDYRDLEQWPRNKVYTKDYGYPLDKSRADPPKHGLRRKWKNITAIMLHTTAVAGMTAKRGLGIPAHFYLPREESIVLCHELELLLYHGHAGNRFSVGMEISGVSDWDSPSQIERGRALLRYFQAVRRKQLGPDVPCAVMAHRQSHESRVRDPGKQIWRDLGEWAIEELGFQLGPVVGSGRNLDEWRKP